MCEISKEDRLKILRYNNIKAAKIQSWVRDNERTSICVSKYLEENTFEMEKSTLDLLGKYQDRLNTCAKNTIWREHKDTGILVFCGAHTCKHKLCAVCNALRSKVVRRKYIKFFEKNPDLLDEYDFMHLTLTVPHDENGYNGEKFYADTIKSKYWEIRRSKWFKECVYGGEYGIEITKNNNGFHIHIHSLLLVRKKTTKYKEGESRNYLFPMILTAWNKSTSIGEEKPLSEDQKEGLLKALKDRSKVEKLKGNGSLMVGLESLYVKSRTPKRGFKWKDRHNAYVKYVNKYNKNEFLSGILECIKYHFEPLALELDGSLDIDLVVELLPLIRGKRLYDRFGAFNAASKNKHKDVKMLSLNDKSLDESIDQEVEELANDQVIDPESGNVLKGTDYSLFVASIVSVYFDYSNDYRAFISMDSRKKEFPPGTDMKSAHRELAEIEIRAGMNKHDYQIKIRA